MEAEMMPPLSLCCFCFEVIASSGEVLLVVLPVPGEEESQSLSAHRHCLVDRVDRRIPLHPDLVDDPSVADEE